MADPRWFDFEPGQTEAGDQLRLHLLAGHGNLHLLNPDPAYWLTKVRGLEGMWLSDGDAADYHTRLHDPAAGHDGQDLTWTVDAVAGQAATPGLEKFLGPDGLAGLNRIVAAHHFRGAEPGVAAARPDPGGPRVFETPTRYAVSVLPASHPHRRNFQILVTQRWTDADRWTVGHRGDFAGSDGTWVPPGELSAGQLFPFETAMALARRLAPTLTVGNKRTALDVLNETEMTTDG